MPLFLPILTLVLLTLESRPPKPQRLSKATRLSRLSLEQGLLALDVQSRSFNGGGVFQEGYLLSRTQRDTKSAKCPSSCAFARSVGMATVEHHFYGCYNLLLLKGRGLVSLVALLNPELIRMYPNLADPCLNRPEPFVFTVVGAALSGCWMLLAAVAIVVRFLADLLFLPVLRPNPPRPACKPRGSTRPYSRN